MQLIIRHCWGSAFETRTWPAAHISTDAHLRATHSLMLLQPVNAECGACVNQIWTYSWSQYVKWEAYQCSQEQNKLSIIKWLFSLLVTITLSFWLWERGISWYSGQCSHPTFSFHHNTHNDLIYHMSAKRFMREICKGVLETTCPHMLYKWKIW